MDAVGVLSSDDKLELVGGDLVGASLEGDWRDLGRGSEGETVDGLDNRPGLGGLLASAILDGGELVGDALSDLGSAVLGSGLHGAGLEDAEGVSRADC